MVEDQVDSRTRHEHGEPSQEVARIEPHMRRAVPPGARQPPEHLAVVTQMQALAHDRWTQYVPAQPLEPCSRAGRHDVSGVEVEAVAPGMAPDRRACARVLEVARLTQARHRLPPPLPERGGVLDRRRRQGAGRGRLVRPSRILARPPLDESANGHLGHDAASQRCRGP